MLSRKISVTWETLAHGVCILIEWDEIKTIEHMRIYNMYKPTFVFYGRNIVDVDKLHEIGFVVYAIGKPLNPWLLGMRDVP